MKKLVYLAIVAFAASMVSCGNSQKEADAEPAEEAPVVVEEAAAVEVDSCANDSCCAVEAAAAEAVEAPAAE